MKLFYSLWRSNFTDLAGIRSKDMLSILAATLEVTAKLFKVAFVCSIAPDSSYTRIEAPGGRIGVGD